MTESLRDRLHWDTQNGQITDDNRRYLMIRNDVLMGIFSQLDAAAAKTALQAFERSVNLSGGQSAKAYFQALGNDTEQLLNTMAAFSSELGWGCWQFTRTPTLLSLEVRNSPFAAGYPKPAPGPVCHPIVGMLRTVGELVFNQPVEVHETQCCSHALHASHCHFTITPSST